jgi:hypothetical protein
MPACYEPIPLDVYMSDQGYWVVVISVEPGLHLTIMMCKVGITREQARDLAVVVTPSYPATTRR